MKKFISYQVINKTQEEKGATIDKVIMGVYDTKKQAEEILELFKYENDEYYIKRLEWC